MTDWRDIDEFTAGMIQRAFAHNRIDWGIGQVVLHVHKRVTWAKISAATGVSVYRLRKAVQIYRDHQSEAAQ